MWQWGGLKQTTFPCDEKIFLPPHDRHKDMSRCYFKGKGFGGKRGAGGTQTHQIKDLSLGLWRKKVQSLRLQSPFQSCLPEAMDQLLFRPHQREGNTFPEQNQRFPDCPRPPTPLQKLLQNRLALPTQLCPGKGKNDGVQEMELSPFHCFQEHHQTLPWRGKVTAWTGEGAILLFAC